MLSTVFLCSDARGDSCSITYLHQQLVGRTTAYSNEEWKMAAKKLGMPISLARRIVAANDASTKHAYLSDNVKGQVDWNLRRKLLEAKGLA